MSHPTLEALLAHRHAPDPQLAAHLADCARCRQAARALEASLGRLVEPELPPLASDQAEAWIQAAVAANRPAERRRRGWAWLTPWLSVAALLLSVTALAVVLRQSAAVDRPAPVPAPPSALAPPPPPAPTEPAPPAPTEPAPPAPKVEAPLPPPAPPREAPALPAEAPAPVLPPAPPTPSARSQEVRTLFREATEALGRGEPEVARQLLLILLELQPGLDLAALAAAEEGWQAWARDPAGAAAAFGRCSAADPTGALGADCRAWACEADPSGCAPVGP